MAFLHTGDFQPTSVFSFYPCDVDSIYLEGLKEGDSLISAQPEFFQNANGHLAIDDRFTTLHVVRGGLPIQSLKLTWNTQCGAKTLETYESTILSDGNIHGFGWILVIGAGVMTVALFRRFVHGNR